MTLSRLTVMTVPRSTDAMTGGMTNRMTETRLTDVMTVA